MLKALALTKKITPFLHNKRILLSQPALFQPFKTSLPIHFQFSQRKKAEPRNKEEAWMMQQQQRLRQSPQDANDKLTYAGLNKIGYITFAVLVSALAFFVNYAETKGEQNLDFFEEEISGLKELKENKSPVGGDWTLIDTSGKAFSSSDLLGSYYLIFFGFTNCPDHCPSALYYMNTIYRVIRNIPEGAYIKLKLVFVSIDPERDTPKEMKSFLSHFSKSMIGISGSEPNDIELREVMKKFKVYSKKVPNKEGQLPGYTIDHSSNMYLMNPDNEYLYHIDEDLTEQQAAKAIIGKIVSNEHRKQKQIQKLHS